MPSLKKNALYNSSYQGIRLIVPLLTYPYVSRLIGPIGIGTVSFAEAVVGYFTAFAMLGVPVYGTRAISQSRANDTSTETDRVFSALFIIITVTSWAALSVYVSLPWIAPALVADRYLFWLFAILLFLNGGNLNWFFSGTENYRYIVTRNLILRFSGLILTFVLVRSSDHYLRYGIVWFFTNISTLLINFTFTFRNVKFVLKDLEIRKHLMALIPTALLVFSDVFYRKIDIFMIGLLVSDQRYSVGIYSTAARIIQIAMTLITAAAAVTVPRVALHYASGDSSAMARVIGRTLSMTLFFAMPMTVGTLFLSADMIHLFAGLRFYQSVRTLQILAPELTIIALSAVISTHILYAQGREKTVLLISLAGFSVALFTNAWLIPLFTYNGAAIATVVSRLIVLLLCLHFSRDQLRGVLFTTEFGRLIFATSVLAIFLWVGKSMLEEINEFFRFLTMVSSSMVVFAVITLRLRIETALRVYSLFNSKRPKEG